MISTSYGLTSCGLDYEIEIPLREIYPLTSASEEFGFSWLVNSNDGTDSAYWEILNSWGVTAQRPNGLFRLKMRSNYNCAFTSGTTQIKTLYFFALDAAFANQVDCGLAKLSLSLDNAAAGKDKLSVTASAYPAGAPDKPTTATLFVGGYRFVMADTSKWQARGRKHVCSDQNEGRLRLDIDPERRRWDFSTTRGDFNRFVSCYDGVRVVLNVNGQVVGSPRFFVYDAIDTKIRGGLKAPKATPAK